MSDYDRILIMAKLWIALGGDADGFAYLWHNIHDTIKELSDE